MGKAPTEEAAFSDLIKHLSGALPAWQEEAFQACRHVPMPNSNLHSKIKVVDLLSSVNELWLTVIGHLAAAAFFRIFHAPQ